ncbi:MAG: hypothetical protein M3533_14825 [Actinomycetota bacterium]|nr:hypothetical protein [Actinomycetota bacterium]
MTAAVEGRDASKAADLVREHIEATARMRERLHGA